MARISVIPFARAAHDLEDWWCGEIGSEPYVFHGRYEGCFAQILADRLDYGGLIVLDEIGELLQVVQPIIE